MVAVEEEGRPAVPTKTMTGVAVLVNGKSVLVLFGHSMNAFSIINQHIHSNSSLCSGATTSAASAVALRTAAQFLRMSNANAEFDHCGSMGSSK